MICDAATMSPLDEVLLITDDIFGTTLAAELDAVTHATYDGELPGAWKRCFGADTLAAYFASYNIYRERRDRSRTPSASGTRASWSRPASVVASRRRARSRSRGGYTSEVASGSEGDFDETPMARHGRLPLPDGSMPMESRQSRGRQQLRDGNLPDGFADLLRDKLKLEDATALVTTQALQETQRRRPAPHAPKSAAKPTAPGPRRWPQGVAPSGGKQIGTISKWCDNGFGFIIPAKGGESLFVHISDIHIERTPGTRRQQLHQLTRWDVEYACKRNAKGKGLVATNVSGPLGRALPADA